MFIISNHLLDQPHLILLFFHRVIII